MASYGMYEKVESTVRIVLCCNVFTLSPTMGVKLSSIIFTSRGTRWGEIFSVFDLYEIYDNNFNYYR